MIGQLRNGLSFEGRLIGLLSLMLDTVLQVILCVGLISNLVALWVILRQDVRKLDIGFALVMAICDLVFVVYKLGEAVYVGVSGDMRPKENVMFGQWHGVITTLLLHISTVCVGYLAALRFWVIVMRRKPSVKKWWMMFAIPLVLLLAWLITAAAHENFKPLATKALFFLDIKTHSWIVGLCRFHMVVVDLLVVIAVNVSYPCIARIYISNLRILQSGRALCKQQIAIYIKIISLVVLYDIAMCPVLFSLIFEVVTGEVTFLTLELIAVPTIFSMTVVNPLVLLTLHHETQCELKDIINHFKAKLTNKSSQVFA
ncbi:hypothetical protein DSO57_1017385 [Entomophthora muscae]|uniref:Uncharacterized protein n=1 Tax=Entomophthora muscae TaxID=34485 RepID=A0ACC2U3C6_9FUNG|nr:hypothetical protein DSO57_1017385 [Entomophthora muscae]